MSKPHINPKDLNSNLIVNTSKYMTLLKIYHHIRYNPGVKKGDVLFKFGKHKAVAEKIWECYHDLKLEWPVEIYLRVFEE
jgi:hypothetical protein